MYMMNSFSYSLVLGDEFFDGARIGISRINYLTVFEFILQNLRSEKDDVIPERFKGINFCCDC